MVKKPLMVVSLCAVVLLVLSSLSNVVGYQSVKSTVNDSPLFTIRTTRAVHNENRRILTSDYLGKGMNTLSFPSVGVSLEHPQQLIERIRSMDDTTFNNFITMVIHQKNHDHKLKNIDSQNLIAVLCKIRNNQNVQKNLNSEIHITANFSTTGAGLGGIILCYIDSILVTIIVFLMLLYIEIKSIFQGTNCFHSFMTGCEDCPEFRGQVYRYLNEHDIT